MSINPLASGLFECMIINMTMDETIKRINELAHKAKTEGLTPEETREREKLRNIYRQSVIGNLKAQLDNTSVKEQDGTIRKLKRD